METNEKEQTTQGQAAPQVFDMAALGAAIAEGITRTQPKRKVTPGQYMSLSAQQPDKRLAHKLTRACYQNGGWMDPTKMTNTEIDLINQIAHSGRYINRLVEVIVGRDGAEEALDLRYNNKTVDQRMNNKMEWRSLTEMLQKIVQEQQDEDLDVETRPSVQRGNSPVTPAVERHFGTGKASREARAAAGV